MDQFEYVMVLVSIIVGLGVAHILQGIGGIIDRLTGERESLGLSLAHATWLVGVMSHGMVLLAVPIALIGMRTRNIVFHNTIGVMFMLWQYLSAFGFLPTLTT